MRKNDQNIPKKILSYISTWDKLNKHLYPEGTPRPSFSKKSPNLTSSQGALQAVRQQYYFAACKS